MEELLEDYKRKLKTITEMLNADTITPETIQRLTVKKGMVASFIVDVERAMADANTDNSGLHLQRVSGMSLSDYAQKKLEYINGNCIAREFPEHQPTKYWAGAVLDLLEDMKLGDYR